MPEVLTIDSDGPVRVVTLNRPEHMNAFDGALHDAFLDALRRLDDRDN